MKKGPLSKKEKTFIESNKEIALEDLSLQMNRSENMISKYIATLKTEPAAAEDEAKIKVEDVSGLFARNEKYGATVMTETASIVSDENKKSKPKMPARTKNCIHRIKD